MLVVIFPVLILLGNFDKVYSSADHIHCEWYCTIPAKSPLATCQTEVWLNIAKFIHQKCPTNTQYRNLKYTTTTGYAFVSLLRKECGYHDGFSLLHFITVTTLDHKNQPRQNKTAMKNISCLLQPKSDQTGIGVLNGLDDLKSLQFYFSYDNQSLNTPLAGYVLLETGKHISVVVPNENVQEEYHITSGSTHRVFSWLIRLWYITYFPRFLTLFCDPHKERKRREWRTKKHQEHDASVQTSSEERENDTAPQVVAGSNTESEKGDDVCLIDGNAPGSPVGMRNFLTGVFSKNSSRYRFFIKLFILVFFPFFILFFIDLFVVGMPQWLIQGSTNLPSPYLTDSVFSHCFKKHSLLNWCFFFHILRMIAVCLAPDFSTIIPSFIDRKHIICFLKTCDYSEYWFSYNQLSVCEECKELKKSEVSSIPDKIQQYGQLLSVEAFVRNREDIYGNPANEVKNCCCCVKFFLFIFVTVLDLIISLPLVSLCLGIDCYSCKKKCKKAVFLFIDLVLIFCSIVWVAYISYCSFFSVEIAFISLLISGMKQPIEILASLAIYGIIGYDIWMIYSFFTGIYCGLLEDLFKVCKKNHGDEMKKYATEHGNYMPKDLFDSACDEIEPVAKNIVQLVVELVVYIIVIFYIFSIVFGTNYPKYAVLPVTWSLLFLLHTFLESSLKKIYEGKRKGSFWEAKLEDVAKAYFKRKSGSKKICKEV